MPQTRWISPWVTLAVKPVVEALSKLTGRPKVGHYQALLRAGGGTRTHDLTITNRLRFQLRHTGWDRAQATEATWRSWTPRLHRIVTVGRLQRWIEAQRRAQGTPGAVAAAP